MISVHSRLVGAIGWLAKLYAGLLALSLVVFVPTLFAKIGEAVFGEPMSYVFTLGWNPPPLVDSARMLESSPLVIAHDSPRLGVVLAELQQILPGMYALAVLGLAVWALSAAHREGLFADTLPRRLGWLSGVLIAQPVWALIEAADVAFLRAHVLTGSTFGGELQAAFVDSLAWPAPAAGAGILLLRSIIIEGITMRRDLDGTV